MCCLLFSEGAGPICDRWGIEISPSGSHWWDILPLLLFIIYRRLWGEVIDSLEMRYYQYADDTEFTIYLHLSRIIVTLNSYRWVLVHGGELPGDFLKIKPTLYLLYAPTYQFYTTNNTSLHRLYTVFLHFFQWRTQSRFPYHFAYKIQSMSWNWWNLVGTWNGKQNMFTTIFPKL